jgi:TIR domain
VFVSYSHAPPDAVYVERLAAFLGAAGVSAWFDRELASGDRWDRVLREKIDTCAALVVVMSPSAADSSWVSREVGRARRGGRPLFPLLLDGTVLDVLRGIQYEAVTHGVMPSLELVFPAAGVHDPSDRPSESWTEPRPAIGEGLPVAQPAFCRSGGPAGPDGSRIGVGVGSGGALIARARRSRQDPAGDRVRLPPPRGLRLHRLDRRRTRCAATQPTRRPCPRPQLADRRREPGHGANGRGRPWPGDPTLVVDLRQCGAAGRAGRVALPLRGG